MGDRDLKSNGVQKNDKSPDVESGKVVDLVSETGKESAATLRSIKNRPVRVLLRRVAVMTVLAAILVGLGAVVWYFLGWMSLVQLILVAVVAYLASGKYRWFYVAIRTAPRDVRALYRFLRLQLQIKSYARNNKTLADIFRENVKKHPNKTAICFEDQEWDFAQLEEYSNKIANVFKSHGYKKGDVVALFMENKPEYVGIWLGLSKLGVIVPFINTNLRLTTLVHSITVAKSQAVIFGSELSDAISEIMDKVEAKTALYQLNGGNNNKASSDQRFKPLDQYLKDTPGSAVPNPENMSHHSNLVYIYTSGTTGLPKAAVISNSRYLATGSTFRCLSFHFVRGDSTISGIIAETTKAIWDSLQPEYLPLPDREKWKNIAYRFKELWNLPNCLGAVDGKHIKIKKVPGSGSVNFNYKHYHSFILMACSDADGLFTTVETGFAGRNSDGGVFRASRFGQWLDTERLIIPEDEVLPNDASGQKFPFYFIGDEAFPLKKFLMRPFPQRTLNNKRRIFNYRLSRGRKTVECSFGMMCQKFQVLQNPILCSNSTTITHIILCCCVLHNFIRQLEGRMYQSTFPDGMNYRASTPPQIERENHVLTRNPIGIRNYLCDYFISSEGSLPWQWQYCV